MMVVGWGAGDIAKRYVARGIIRNLKFVIDGNIEKSGTIFCGYRVVHSSEIDDWSDLFIIVLVENDKAIIDILEKKGLVRNRNFISYLDYLSSCNNIVNKQQNLMKNCNAEREYSFIVRNKNEYDAIDKNNIKKYESALHELYSKNNYVGQYKGYCPICGKEVNLRVEYIDNEKLNNPIWSETLKCPECLCNRRNRFAYEYISQFDSDIEAYIYEYTTNNYRNYKKIFPNLVGSEFWGEQYKSGEIIDGIMHQDALDLSFESNSFELMMSFDVFEHVADCEKAFSEARRCLKDGGKLIFTIPFDEELSETVVRAYVDEEGKLIHMLEPEIHGNPLSDEGSLAFYNYGWDIIDMLKKVGFSDSYTISYFSGKKGYLGNYCLLFVAEK